MELRNQINDDDQGCSRAGAIQGGALVLSECRLGSLALLSEMQMLNVKPTSDEFVVSIFKVEEYAKQETAVKQVASSQAEAA
jgi:hypothetical protein